MEKRITFYPPQTWRGRFLGTILTLVALLLTATTANAQDVLIDPESGNVVSTVTNREETGFALGLGALWRHEQLALSLNATDRDNVTDAGDIATPSAVLGKREIEIAGEKVKRLTIIGGRRPSFLTVSLPKGYKITGYEIVLLNDLSGDIVPENINTQGWDRDEINKLNQFRNINAANNGLVTNDHGTAAMLFYETTCWEHNKTNSRDQNQWNNNGEAFARYIKEGLNVNTTDREIGSTVINTATRTDDSSDKYIDAVGDRDKEFSMSRFNINTNQLYFRLVKNYFFYGITIKSFKIYFSAEGDFEQTITPTSANYPRRVVTSGFDTNKTDIGKLTQQSQDPTNPNAPKYFSYNYHNVKTLKAYNYIYQENAVKDGEPYEVSTIDAHIHPVRVNNQDLYAFENDVYYAEPPISVSTSSGLTAPIGFRIVGAKIEYLWGPDQVTNCYKTIPNGFYIIYNHIRYGSNESETVTPYYLHNDPTRPYFTTEPFLWYMDDDGNITDDLNDGSPERYLSCNGEGVTRVPSWSTSADPENEGKWNMHTEDNGNVYYYSDGLNYYNLEAVLDNTGVPTGEAIVVKGGLENLAKTSYQPGGHTVLVSSFMPGEYDLNIYDQTTGNTIDNAKSVHVTKDKATGPNNYVELTNLNNDAIKFEVSGLQSIPDPNYPDDEDKKIPTKALLKITLKLQALDPYINSMLVECKDLPEQLQLSQGFTASNFRVSGGSFIFYVPNEMKNQDMKISFSDLHSDYGDNTYWGENLSLTKSRYSFVTSDYFKEVSGNQKSAEQLIALGMTAAEAAEWPKNDGLYDASYNPDAVYTTKVTTATAGNVRYKFNNAEDLEDNTQTGSAFLQEYPFSVDTYLSSYDDPDAKANETPKKAKFEHCIVKAGNGEQEAGSFFVFTADETRYNIGKATNWQHRAYAFYRMDVKAVAEEYYPVLVWTKVYDHALQATKDAGGNEVKTDKPQFGLKLLTKKITGYDSDNKPIVGDFFKGYLTVKQINETITAAIAAENETSTGDVPTSRDQILYIDACDLLGVYNFTENGEVSTLTTLKQDLGANALIFLPNQSGTHLNNFVKLTDANTFLATNDIELTDKQPFYTPYDIQLQTQNYVSYKRMISDALNGQAKLATIMLPFNLTLDEEGVHTNPADVPAAKFSVNIMSPYDKYGNPIDMKDQKVNVDYGTAYFTPLKNQETADANMPYMIKVEETSADNDDDFSFIAVEKGAKIIATPTTGVDNNIGTGKLHVDESPVSVKYGNATYTFTNKGTFSGAKFDRAKSENVFYFANNKYMDLHYLYAPQLTEQYQYLYIYPFRGVYTYEKSGDTGAKRMQWFNISFDEPTHGVATDITNVSDADLIVKTGKGIVTMSASRSQDVTIYTVSGINSKRVALEAGDTKTVNLPAGVYMINNVKVIVK